MGADWFTLDSEEAAAWPRRDTFDGLEAAGKFEPHQESELPTPQKLRELLRELFEQQRNQLPFQQLFEFVKGVFPTLAGSIDKSLDEPHGDSGATLAEVIEDPTALSPADYEFPDAAIRAAVQLLLLLKKGVERNGNKILLPHLDERQVTETMDPLARFDLRLMSIGDLSEIPEIGLGLLIITKNVRDDTLHFRAFNSAGERVLEISETQIPKKSTEKIKALKEFLAELWDRGSLTADQQTSIKKAVTSIIGHTLLAKKLSKLANDIEGDGLPAHIMRFFLRVFLWRERATFDGAFYNDARYQRETGTNPKRFHDWKNQAQPIIQRAILHIVPDKVSWNDIKRAIQFLSVVFSAFRPESVKPAAFDNDDELPPQAGGPEEFDDE